MYLLVIACVVASAYARNCCSPTKWEGTLAMVIASRKSETDQHLTEGTIAMSYDAANRVIAQTQNLTVDGAAVQQKLIIEYNKGITNIIKADGSCYRSASSAWVSNCIPDNATVSDIYFGLDANSVKAKSYMIDFGNSEVYMSVTSDTCVPITEDVVGTFNGAQILERIVFVDISAGIKDQSVFNVPAQCSSVALGPPIPELGRRSLFR